jgi:hypothetical protein
VLQVILGPASLRGPVCGVSQILLHDARFCQQPFHHWKAGSDILETHFHRVLHPLWSVEGKSSARSSLMSRQICGLLGHDPYCCPLRSVDLHKALLVLVTRVSPNTHMQQDHTHLAKYCIRIHPAWAKFISDFSCAKFGLISCIPLSLSLSCA